MPSSGRFDTKCLTVNAESIVTHRATSTKYKKRKNIRKTKKNLKKLTNPEIVKPLDHFLKLHRYVHINVLNQ
jgi:hypothetical protein